MSQTLFDRLLAEVQALVEPVIEVGEDPTELGPLLYELGVAAENPGVADITAALKSAFDLVNQVEALADNPSPSFDGIAHLLDTARQALTAVQGLNGAGGAAAGLEGFGEELVQLLVGVYLSRYHPMIYKLGILLTFIETFEDAQTTEQVVNGDTEVRAAVTIPRFRPERLVALLRDPEGTLRAFYGNPLATADDAHAMADKLFPRIGGILTELDVSWRYGVKDREQKFLGDAVPLIDHSLTVFASDQFGGDTVDAGVTLTLSPATAGDLGLVVCPFGALTIKDQFGRWTLELDVTAEVEAFTWGRHGFNLVASPSTTQIDASFSAKLAAPDKGPAFVFGAPNASRLEIGGAEIDVKTTVSTSTLDLALSAAVSSSKIVIAPGDGDGFVAKILPAEGLEAKFDLGVAWSNHTGLSFRGAAGLEATLPVGLSIGGVLTVPTIYLGLYIADAALVAEVSASVGLSIGPVKAVVDRIGLTLAATFPDSGGTLGIADLGFGFKPPSGVGLAVDAAGVSGGGFLRHDDAKHEYSGVLQLQFIDLALQAFGLITTQVAGGRAIRCWRWWTPSFRRSSSAGASRSTAWAACWPCTAPPRPTRCTPRSRPGSFRRSCFRRTRSPMRRAILAQLDALFPTAPGRFLFGPMALIGWGTPTMLTASIAVMSGAARAGAASCCWRASRCGLPTRRRRRWCASTWTRWACSTWARTSCRSTPCCSIPSWSTYTLSGAWRCARTGRTQREFVLAIGGLHPQFTPPPGLPGAAARSPSTCRRGIVTKLRLAAYLALTSNTMQFGAKLDVFIGVSGFGLSGHLGFDALLQLRSVPLRRGHFRLGRADGGRRRPDLGRAGRDAVRAGALAHRGASSRSTSCSSTCTISFSTAGATMRRRCRRRRSTSGAAAGARWRTRDNWDAQLPDGLSPLVSVRQIEDASVGAGASAGAAGGARAHRAARAGDHALRRSGAQRRHAVHDHGLCTSAAARSSTTTMQDDFAPAQFFDLTDEEKLARPSFERHDAGVR